MSWLPLGPARLSLRVGFSRQAILLILNGLRDAVGRQDTDAARFRVVADVELTPGDGDTTTLTLELRAEERTGA